jgi:hypothetical protein
MSVTAVQVLAVDALGTNAAREEEAEVGAWRAVGFGVPAVFGHIAAPGGGRLAQVRIFAVAAAPFVVPYVEDGARCRRRFGFECRGIDLWPRGTALATDDLLDFLAFCICRDDGLFGDYGRELGRCRGFERRIWRCERRLRGWRLDFGHAVWYQIALVVESNVKTVDGSSRQRLCRCSRGRLGGKLVCVVDVEVDDGVAWNFWKLPKSALAADSCT